MGHTQDIFMLLDGRKGDFQRGELKNQGSRPDKDPVPMSKPYEGNPES